VNTSPWLDNLVPALVELLPEAKGIAVADGALMYFDDDKLDDFYVARATFTSLEIGAECVMFLPIEKGIKGTDCATVAPFMAKMLRDAFADDERVRFARGDYE
jgi:hypothetical protein